MKYYEIYVAGKNGFSTYVKTDKPMGNDIEGEILTLAVAGKIIDGSDAKDVYHGDGYVEELEITDEEATRGTFTLI